LGKERRVGDKQSKGSGSTKKRKVGGAEHSGEYANRNHEKHEGKTQGKGRGWLDFSNGEETGVRVIT